MIGMTWLFLYQGLYSLFCASDTFPTILNVSDTCFASYASKPLFEKIKNTHIKHYQIEQGLRSLFKMPQNFPGQPGSQN